MGKSRKSKSTSTSVRTTSYVLYVRTWSTDERHVFAVLVVPWQHERTYYNHVIPRLVPTLLWAGIHTGPVPGHRVFVLVDLTQDFHFGKLAAEKYG